MPSDDPSSPGNPFQSPLVDCRPEKPSQLVDAPSDGNPPRVTDKYDRPIFWGSMIHVLLLLAAALTLDTGKILILVVPSILLHLLQVAFIIARRPTDPTRLDLMMVRLGSLLWLVILALGKWIVRGNLLG